MSQRFTAAEERARLAAADLMAAANVEMMRHSLTWEDARDEVGAALLSRRWTGYAPSGMRKLDDARDDLAIASRARIEIANISASLSAVAAGGSEDAAAAEAALIGRLDVLAAECERRAVLLRS